MAERRLLTAAEIAADLHVSTETVYGWLRSGELPSKRYGQRSRVKASDYVRWCESRPDGEQTVETVQRKLPSTRVPKQVAGQRVERLLDFGALLAQRQAARGG